MSNTLEVETPEGGIEKSDIKEAEEEVINNNNNNNNGIIVTENNINNTEPPPAKDKDTEEITSEKEEEQQETTSDQEACECEDGTCEDDSNTTDTQNTTKNIPIKKKKRRSRKSTLSQPLSRHSSSPELPTHLTKINKSTAQKDVLSDSQTTTTTTTVSDGATSPKHPNTMTKSTSEPLPITADIASLINEKSSTPSSSSSSSSSSSPKIPTSIPPNIAPHSPYDTSHIPQHLLDLTPPPTRGRSNAFYGSKAPPPLLHSHSDGAAIASQQTSNTIAARRNTTTAGMMMMAHGGVVPAGMQLTLSIPEPSCSGISKPKMFNYWRSLSTSHCEKVLSPSRRFLVGFAETIGRRPTMEDCMVVHGSFRGRGHEDYFALFDGHGGKDAADFAALHLHEILAEKLKTSNAVKSLREAFAETHNLIADQKIIGGTTAVVALFIGKKGFIANVGDTRAVLCRDGVPLRVSLDHKPELPAEMSRIRKLGGTVTTTYNSAGQATSRVNGMLAVSRALGDAVLSPYVSSEPEIHGPLNLDTESRNQFVVLACDGVWDVLSDEEATSIVAPIANPEIASRRLRDEAFARGSTDNISVMVIRCPPFLPCD